MNSRQGLVTREMGGPTQSHGTREMEGSRTGHATREMCGSMQNHDTRAMDGSRTGHVNREMGGSIQSHVTRALGDFGQSHDTGQFHVMAETYDNLYHEYLTRTSHVDLRRMSVRSEQMTFPGDFVRAVSSAVR